MTAQLLLPTDPYSEPATRPCRISFRQPVATTGFIDAAWWPRSIDLTTELPPLLAVLWDAGREINRITYCTGAWAVTPRRMQIQGRTVRLGGFATGDPLTARLSDPWGKERIDILVIAPETDPGLAERALRIAGEAGNSCRAAEIMAQAAAGAGSASGS